MTAYELYQQLGKKFEEDCDELFDAIRDRSKKD